MNDHYGHEAGDLTLVTAAERKRASLRTGDMLARWGGEEFILIMPNTYACTQPSRAAKTDACMLAMQ